MIRKIFVCWMIFTIIPIALAQEILEPEMPVTGEITDDAFYIEYQFEGMTNQVIVIELFPVDILADYDEPAIVILNSAGEELLQRESFGKTTAIFEFPSDDTYTIVATRADGADGTSIGEYTLEILIPVELEIGSTLEGSLTSDEDVYYVYRMDDDFNINFSRQGTFAPEISVNTIDVDVTPGSLDTVGVVSGEYITQSTFGTFPGNQLYVIQIGAPLFSFNFGDPSAEYTLQLVAP